VIGAPNSLLLPGLLDIIFQNENVVVINKPAGYFVHNTKLASRDEKFLLQLLRDQIGRKVYPTHRLDKKTTGVLIFALDKETQSEINLTFRERTVHKKYLAIVRGWTDDSFLIDSKVKNSKGESKSAETKLKTLEKFEINKASGKHASSRYSLVELIPKTGRFHQLRIHMARINHPIIGDRPHGCNKQNRFFKNTFDLHNMMLHAFETTLEIQKEAHYFKAHLPKEFQRILTVLKQEY